MKDFIGFIKEYSTENFIYTFAEISIEIYRNHLKNNGEEGFHCTKTFPLNILSHGFLPKTVPVMLSAWEIPDMAYASICNANDYRKRVVKKDEIGRIVNLYRGYVDDKPGSEYLKYAELADVFKYLMGITSEQFRHETLGWVIQNFNRNYHMLLGSSKISRDKILNINEIVQKTFGMNVDELLTIELIIMWLCSKHANPLSAPEDLYYKKAESFLTKKNLRRVIEYYSTTYEEVRDSKLEKQIFYSKPFVYTQKSKEYIMISMYLLQMVIADGLYWLIRDYYLNNKMGQAFMNAFGEMFEDYFEELMIEYMPDDSWHKIATKKKKSADYYLEIENAVFLFELKSGLMRIGGRQQTPNIDQIDDFYRRNIVEAYEQLKNSAKDYQGTKPVIKIFLLYEFSNNTQLIMSSIPEIFDNDKECYIMSIQDLEMFLPTYKKERGKFNRVVEEMLNGNIREAEYKCVLSILNDQQATKNFHFVKEKDYLKRIMDKLEIELE